jgi:hypothetical protein
VDVIIIFLTITLLASSSTPPVVGLSQILLELLVVVLRFEVAVHVLVLVPVLTFLFSFVGRLLQITWNVVVVLRCEQHQVFVFFFIVVSTSTWSFFLSSSSSKKNLFIGRLLLTSLLHC